MRLTEAQVKAIQDNFFVSFMEGDKIWLFGSRVDDSKKGGDIDLAVDVDLPHDEFRKKKIAFLKMSLRLSNLQTKTPARDQKKLKTVLIAAHTYHIVSNHIPIEYFSFGR